MRDYDFRGSHADKIYRSLEDAGLLENPGQVEQGPQKAPTYKWLLTRGADGSEKTAPRELIQLLNCLLAGC
jgi:hypothetical protein